MITAGWSRAGVGPESRGVPMPVTRLTLGREDRVISEEQKEKLFHY